MKRLMLSAASALAAIGYSHGTTETVMVKRKGWKDPVRVNRSDFDTDQAGAKEFTEYTGDDAEALNTGIASDVNATGANGVQTTAAPSAPNFAPAENADPLPVDPVKQAAAPSSTTVDQLLVMKSGTGKNAKFFIADGVGNKITGDKAKLLGIDESGYDTEEAAKAVQTRTEPSDAPVPPSA